MSQRRVLLILAVATAAGPGGGASLALADDALDSLAVDVDGDGDVDADDRALLGDAEVVELVEVSDATAAAVGPRSVTVLDTRAAGARARDLGAVLAAAPGVAVRRQGGLGATARISLDGLGDQQVRLFLDGVPLELTGWGDSLADVPVELVSRVEVHRGVAPVALGADALGGAIDLVTEPSWASHGTASYLVGSFGIHRATATARGRDPDSGLALGLGLFADRATNDYPVDVELPDPLGRPRPTTVRLHNADYRAAGGNVELGVVERGPVQRALLRLFAAERARGLPHNAVMTVPYGEVRLGETTAGAALDVAIGRGRWQGRLLAGGSQRWLDFRDVATVVHDWAGRVLRPRVTPGELGGGPTDRRVRARAGYARLSLERAVGRASWLRATLAPTLAWRRGDDFLEPNPEGRDPLDARRDLAQLVSGVEVEHHTGGLRLLGLAKHYGLSTAAEDVRAGYTFVPIDRRLQRFGVGAALRYQARALSLTASYERAIRLPSVDELFGDGVLIQPSLGLGVERSHNLDLGVGFAVAGRRGELGGEARWFARLVDDQIVLVGDDRYLIHQNVLAARVLGVDGHVGWTSAGGRASVAAAATVQDPRNTSRGGTFVAYAGDRLPSRPWLFGALSGQARAVGLARDDDEVTAFAAVRYVHGFYRAWESAGLASSKQTVPAQAVVDVGATWAVRGPRALTITVELDDVTDARAHDSYGVQRPGRALAVKVGGSL